MKHESRQLLEELRALLVFARDDSDHPDEKFTEIVEGATGFLRAIDDVLNESEDARD